MFCRNCGEKLEESSLFCSKCGAKVAESTANNTPTRKKKVVISCPVCPGQFFNNACIAYNDNTGEELARCKQGETLIFDLEKATPIKVVVKGAFGKPVAVMSPGDKYKIGYRALGKVYLAKVDFLQ